MSIPLNILMVEDSEDDSLLILRELRRGGYSVHFQRVETAKTMQKALKEAQWDVIISDYNLPGFNGLAALQLFKQSGLDIPFFLVSGAIGEDIAVDAMKSGAQDYIKKENLARLIPAIQRELREVEVRLDRAYVKEKLQDSETRYRALVENIPVGVFRSLTRQDAMITMANLALVSMLGFDTVGEIHQHRLSDLFPSESEFNTFVSTLFREGSILAKEIQLKKREGSLIWVSITARINQYQQIEQKYFDATIEDISPRKQSEIIKDALYRISQAAFTSTSLEELVEAVHLIIGKLMPAQNLYLALYDKATNILSFPYFVDQYDTCPPPQPLNKGLTSYVIRTGNPLLVEPKKSDELVNSGEVENAGSACVDWLGVPLKTTQNETIGALVVQTYSVGIRYTDREKEVLAFVSDQLGAMIERKKADDALRASEARQRALLEAIPDMIFVMNRSAYVLDCKIPTGTKLKVKQEEIIGQHAAALLPEPVSSQIMDAIAMIQVGEKMRTFQVEIRIGRSLEYNFEVRLTPGEAEQVLALVRDITEAVQSEKRMEQQRVFLRQVIDINPNLIFAKDVEGRFTLANQALADAYGTTVEDLFGKTDQDFSRPFQEIENNRSNDLEVLNTLYEKVTSEELLVDVNGRERWLQTVRRPLILSQHHEVQVLGVSTDISERKKVEEQMLHNAFFDSLTELPNRAMTLQRLENSIRHFNADNPTSSAFLMLDLDQFAVLNDSLGYRIGDLLLAAISKRLKEITDDKFIVARTGGDEFTIFMPEIAADEMPILLAERVIEELHKPFILQNERVVITISVGLVLGLGSYDKPDDILRDADIALHRAKALGRNQYAIFDDVMRANVVARLEMENDLRQAIDSQQLEIYFEPIISLVTGKAQSFEALLRWNHPTRGLVMPGSFIPFAEETGLIIPLGKWILYQVCRQMRVWEIQYPWTADVIVAVNISGKQFAQPDIVDLVKDALESSGLGAHRLRLEITESVLMENPDLAVKALNELQQMGVKIYIDDFGTGYSSLYYLHNLPLNAIKIDRSFISGKARVKSGSEIVHTIVRLANELQLDTVAEGVETVEQLKWMMELGLNFVQGFLFFSSLGTRDFENFLAEKKSETDWVRIILSGE